MKTIATTNILGGAGKTTVAWCLGDLLSTVNKCRVLLFDLDPGMYLTKSIPFDRDRRTFGRFDNWTAGRSSVLSVLARHLEGDPTSLHIGNDFVYRLKQKYHFVPLTEQLPELNSTDPDNGRFLIKALLDRIEDSTHLPDYEFVLFDCPATCTMLSCSILPFCDLILIPFIPDYLATQYIGKFVATLNHRIQSHPMPQVAVFANRVRTHAQSPTRGAQVWMDCVRDQCEFIGESNGPKIQFLQSWIPLRTSLQDAIVNRRIPYELETNFLSLWSEIKGIV